MYRNNSIKRIFAPGSEWLYFKIYTGSVHADKILAYELPKIISALNRKRLIDKWFFIRYADPDFHLRLRFLLKDSSYAGEAIQLLYSCFKEYIKNGIVWKIQIDTYVREIERYKAEVMEDGESLFHIDSIHIIRLLHAYKETQWQEKERLLLGIKMIDQYLDMFRYSVEQKQEMLQILDSSFKAEFGYNKFNSKQLNILYREYMTPISQMMDIGFRQTNQLLEERYEAMKNIADLILGKIRLSERNDLLRSYIHMMMNRWFNSKNRIYELLAYNFLNRYYKSLIAKRQ